MSLKSGVSYEIFVEGQSIGGARGCEIGSVR